MPIATVDGLPTHYQMVGSGSPVLMLAPGGFDATIDNWFSLGLYRRLELVEQLAQSHTLVLFDKRESGQSGARVERLAWQLYVRQGLGLLAELGIERADVLGGCVGCSIGAAIAVAAPSVVRRLVLVSPAGGAAYRLLQHRRFAEHAAYVQQNGLRAVIAAARETEDGFSKDPRIGPWGAALRRDREFAGSYVEADPALYVSMILATARTMFDRDSVPGIEPEDLMHSTIPTLVVPGSDRSHATSAARFLQECIPGSEYVELAVEEQTIDTLPPRILEFLAEG